MRAEWVSDRSLDAALSCLMPPNRLVLKVSLVTGLRVGDVLSLTVDDVTRGRPTVREQKTGKTRRVYIPEFLRDEILREARAMHPKAVYAFPGRINPEHSKRTRQAVYKDMRRACDALRLDSNLTPHSARKIYAVNELHTSGDLTEVQKQLNHSDPAVTMLYAMADQIRGTSYRARRRRRKKDAPEVSDNELPPAQSSEG